MSEKLPWFHFYATDWISDERVRLMSGRQRGWYIDLLAHDWQEGGIPDDVERCRNLTSFWADYAHEETLVGGGPCDTQMARVGAEFGKIFEIFRRNGHGRRFHPRLQGQRRAILVKHSKQREGAMLTNAKRSAKRSAGRNGKRALSERLAVQLAGVEPESDKDYIEEASYTEPVEPAPKSQLAAAAAAVLAAAHTEPERTAPNELTDPGLAACALALDLCPREHPRRRRCELALMEAHERITHAEAPRKYAERIVQDILRRA